MGEQARRNGSIPNTPADHTDFNDTGEFNKPITWNKCPCCRGDTCSAAKLVNTDPNHSTTGDDEASRKHNKHRRQNLEFSYVCRSRSELPGTPVTAVPPRVPEPIWGGSGPGPPEGEWRGGDGYSLWPRPISSPANGRLLGFRRECESSHTPTPLFSSGDWWSSQQLGPIWGGRGPGRPFHLASSEPDFFSAVQREHAVLVI